MKKRLLKRSLLSTLIVLLLILIIWTVWCNSALMISKSTVSSSHIPSAFNGFRIAQVSNHKVILWYWSFYHIICPITFYYSPFLLNMSTLFYQLAKILHRSLWEKPFTYPANRI